MEIKRNKVTIDGQDYKAFQNSFSKKWYIVAGCQCDCPTVMGGIKAKSGNEALKIWLTEMSLKDTACQELQCNC
jgi:hypothetical protein